MFATRERSEKYSLYTKGITWYKYRMEFILLDILQKGFIPPSTYSSAGRIQEKQIRMRTDIWF